MMKNYVLVLAVFGLSFSLFAQESEVRSPGSFKGVKTGDAIDVYLKKGDKESVRVEVKYIELRQVVTEISGGYLKIHMKEGNYRGKREVKVYVTYVELEKVAASSASNVFAEGVIKAKTLEVHAASAANIEINLEVENLTVRASSAGEVNLQGKAMSVDAQASSAGEVDAYNLTAENAEASTSSAGSIKLTVTQSLVAHASSGGEIRYHGSPAKSNTSSSSGGSVKKSN